MSLNVKHDELEKKQRNEQNLDRISSLPDEVIGHILSFLTTKCGVSTSILSTKWQNLFTLTNSLWFDDKICVIHGEEEEEPTEEQAAARKRSFETFVNRVLALHQISPIKNFSLYCQYTYEISLLHSWINTALQKGVQELNLWLYNKPNDDPPPFFFDFHFQFMQPEALPHCFFSSQTLVVLKLRLYTYHFAVPESVSLPSLKILHLDNVTFEDSASRFFAGCPVLEELNVFDCLFILDQHLHIYAEALKSITIAECCAVFDGQVDFDAPNLAYVTYKYNIKVGVALFSKKLCSILKAEVASCFDNLDDSNNQLAVGLVRAACNTKELHLERDILYNLTNAEDDHLPVFPKLEQLHLDCCLPCNAWKYLMHWLASSPQLEIVSFREDDDAIRANWTSSIYCPPIVPKWTSISLAPFSSSVKVITVYEFRGYKPVIALLEHLLRHTGALEKLILHEYCHKTKRSRKNGLLVKKELLAVRKASQHRTIEIELV